MEKIYKVKNICCANCAAEIERKINKLKGVESASIGFMTQRLIVNGEDPDSLVPDMNKIIKKVERDAQIVT